MNKLKLLSISSLVSLLCGALFAANEPDVIASVEYFYAQDGTLIGRAVNGIRQNFEYDKRGQLLAVKDANGRDLERYTYDPAGNRLSKTVNGITTTYTYDEANQLKTSTVNGETTHYRYDAAGRLVQAGDKTYYYFGANDRVTEVRRGDKVIAEFDYFMDGQIASAKYPDREESFTWDGLALVQRNEVSYLNEPYVTGGNPILSSQDGVMFNDMLGSTLNIGRQPVSMNSFGETEDDAAFFTGKPMISELGYSFLFRDYNPDQGKWTSSDPLGYPDGWNSFAYVNNSALNSIDMFGFRIYDLCDRQAAGTYGHSAQIVTIQNKNGAWMAYTYDYGGAFSSTTGFVRTVSESATEEGAMKAAIRKLDPQGNTYDNMAMWDADNSQSIIAKATMDSYVTSHYDPGEHNCRGNLKAGLEKAGYVVNSDFSAKTSPATANTEDVGLEAKDLTKLLRSIQRSYAE